MKKVIFTLLSLFSFAASAAPMVTNHLHISEAYSVKSARDEMDNIYPCQRIGADEVQKFQFTKNVKDYMLGQHYTKKDIAGGFVCGKGKAAFALVILK